jgi:hypothetical protein
MVMSQTVVAPRHFSYHPVSVVLVTLKLAVSFRVKVTFYASPTVMLLGR